jgi:copper chaperone
MSQKTHSQWTYTVTGMTCAHCVRSVTAEVRAIPGVQGVVVDLHRGEVGVIAEQEPDLEAVRAAVEEAGYELVGLPS